MRKYLYLVLIALLAFTVVQPSFAVDGDQTTQVGFRIDADGDTTVKSLTTTGAISTGSITATGNILGRRSIEIVTTSDTLTTGESGKKYVYKNTINSMFTLPAASNTGIEYTFSDGSSTATQLAANVTIDTVAGDYFQYLTTMASGDSLKNPSSPASGDSVTITADGTNYWYLDGMVGTWQDGN